MRTLSGVLVVLSLSGLVQPRPSSLVLRNANVIDGVSQEPVLGVSVVVVDGRIAAFGSTVTVPPGASEIDLAGRWLMPGLIDAHTHVGTLAAARAALASGVTTLRTMNVGRYDDIGIRARHRDGHKDLPDLLAGGYQLRPDMFEEFFLEHPALAGLKPRVSGAANVRRLVAANAARGVDHIKILATERGGTPETDPRRRRWTDEELSAIVDEARKNGLPVVAHAHGDEGEWACASRRDQRIELATGSHRQFTDPRPRWVVRSLKPWRPAGAVDRRGTRIVAPAGSRRIPDRQG